MTRFELEEIGISLKGHQFKIHKEIQKLQTFRKHHRQQDNKLDNLLDVANYLTPVQSPAASDSTFRSIGNITMNTGKYDRTSHRGIGSPLPAPMSPTSMHSHSKLLLNQESHRNAPYRNQLPRMQLNNHDSNKYKNRNNRTNRRNNNNQRNHHLQHHQHNVYNHSNPIQLQLNDMESSTMTHSNTAHAQTEVNMGQSGSGASSNSTDTRSNGTNSGDHDDEDNKYQDNKYHDHDPHDNDNKYDDHNSESSEISQTESYTTTATATTTTTQGGGYMSYNMNHRKGPSMLLDSPKGYNNTLSSSGFTAPNIGNHHYQQQASALTGHSGYSPRGIGQMGYHYKRGYGHHNINTVALPHHANRIHTSVDNNKWECGECHSSNLGKTSKCQMCGKERVHND